MAKHKRSPRRPQPLHKTRRQPSRHDRRRRLARRNPERKLPECFSLWGRPPVYGHHRISLAKRAGQPGSWQSITYRSRGVNVTCEYKTFEATSRLMGGVIRGVLVRDEGRWVAQFCTPGT